MVDEPVEEPLDQSEEDLEGGPVKSFLDHLEDLRWVLIKSLVALSICALICMLGANHVVEILKRPLKKARISYKGTNQVLTVYFSTNRLGVLPLSPVEEKRLNDLDLGLGTNRFVTVQLEPIVVGTNLVMGWHVNKDPELAERAQRLNIDIVNLGPPEAFFVAFQVGIYGGFGLASPLIFYFVGMFVFPALKMKEKYYIYRALLFAIVLFFIGVTFCYFLLMPIALAASQAFSQWLGFSATQWKAEEYLSFVCKFILGMGLGFEMPVIILTMVKIGILNYRILKAGRKYMIVINLILGALLTTPEVITQVIMFIPLQLLYEISIWVAWYWDRQDKKRAEAELPQ